VAQATFYLCSNLVLLIIGEFLLATASRWPQRFACTEHEPPKNGYAVFQKH
jgi:hypothetical protein